MKNRKEIQEELKSFGITWAASDPCSMPYSMPNNYFEKGLQPLIADLQAGIEPSLEDLSTKSTPYTLPEKYFQELPLNIIASAKALENVQAMIHENNTQIQIKEQDTLQKESAKSIKPDVLRTMASSRWIIAASMAGVLCLASFYFWMQTDASIETAQVNIPASIPDTEILNFLESSSIRADVAIINEENNTIQPVESDYELLREVSDDELFAYVSQSNNSFN
jgi:hypothetical protein